MPSKKNRNLRKRRFSDSDNETEEFNEADSVEDKGGDPTAETILLAKQMKELRKRPRGLVADVTKKSGDCSKVDSTNNTGQGQPRGGLIDLKSNFLAESQKGDIDRQMLNFIETELKKHRGEEVDLSPTKADPCQSLFQLPGHLNVQSAIKGDDMMSQQMLEGIPEVDLGITNKIRNIEATEAAKQKLLQEARTKNLSDSTYNVKGFVPNNVTLNFVQHNRWDGEGVFKSLVPHAPTKLKKAASGASESGKLSSK